MTFKNKIADFFFYLMIGTLYAYALSTAVMAATILETSDTQLFLLCLVCILILYLVFYNKLTILIVFGGLALAALALYLSLRRQRFEVQWFLSLKDAMDELIRFGQDLVPYDEKYNFPVCLLTVAAVSLLTAVNMLVRYNFYILTALAAAVFIVPYTMDWGHSDFAVVLFILCFLALLSKKLSLFITIREKGERRKNSGVDLAAIPLCVLAVGISSLLPKPDVTRYSIDPAENLFLGTGKDQTRFYSEAGGRLGGPTALNNQFVMEVQSDDPVYLSGLALDTYTGSSWELSEEEHLTLTPDENIWYLATEYPKQQYEQQQYYMRYYGRDIKSVMVYLHENRTRTVFSAPFRTNLWISENVSLQKDTVGQLSVKNPLSRNTAYALEYISWDYNNEYLIYLLQNTDKSDEYSGDLSRFLALPESLPQRVSDLTQALTEGLGNDYDKIKALETYLAASYPYTLEPDLLPRGTDFVDYFLFEGQEGYCVYYATALAVMGRSAGIPTRYVEGFAMPQERNANGNFTVTNTQAHAWVEAYFPGFGWVPFEATPSNYDVFYGGEPDVPGEETPLPAEEGEQAEEPAPPPEIDTPDASTVAPGDKTEDIPGKRLSLPVKILIGAAILSALGFLFVELMIAIYRSLLAKIDKLPHREAAIAYYDRLLRIAKATGHPILENETAHAYAERIGMQITFADGAVSWKDLADIFCEAAYSTNAVSQEEKDRMKGCYQELLRSMNRTGMDKLKTFIRRYILMRF